MKKFLALLLALTLALSLAVPAYAADPTEEDALDWAALEAELAKAEAEQRAAALKELGAAAGQINVLLNDKCVASPDAFIIQKDVDLTGGSAELLERRGLFGLSLGKLGFQCSPHRGMFLPLGPRRRREQRGRVPALRPAAGQEIFS